jgi:hypothetical protein
MVLRRAHADFAGSFRHQVGDVLGGAAGGQVGVAAQVDRHALRRHAVEFVALLAHHVGGLLVQRDPGQDIGVARAARRIAVLDLDQFAHASDAVAGDLRRTAPGCRRDLVAGDQHAVVAPAQEALDDHVAAVLAGVGRRARPLPAWCRRGHALALVGVERLDRHGAARRAPPLGLGEGGDGLALRHRHAGLVEQGLGQVLVAGDVHRDIAGGAGDGGLQAFLAAAPAELEQVGLIGDAQARDAAPLGRFQHGAVLVPIAYAACRSISGWPSPRRCPVFRRAPAFRHVDGQVEGFPATCSSS